jgi:hypothetical protein
MELYKIHIAHNYQHKELQSLISKLLKYCGKRDGSVMSCIQSTKINTSSAKINYHSNMYVCIGLKSS